MTRCFLALALAALAVGACERPSERNASDRERAGRIMLGALAYPRSLLLTYATGEQAAEVVLTTAASLDEVVGWYRTAFQLNAWDLKTESRERDGTVTLYAEQRSRPLWVRLRANTGGPGTTYSVIGAEVQGDTIR
jgi:hypothetical protein